jgi:anti-sigma B factor antagonist
MIRISLDRQLDRPERTTLVLTVAGELDRTGVRELRDLVFTPTTVSAELLVIDLSATTFLDSSGVGALVAARRWANAHDTRVTLVCPPGQARRTLEIVGLDRVLTLHPTLASAIDDGPVEPSPSQPA